MRTSKNLFGYEEVERYIYTELTPLGYEVEIINGSLMDNYICYPPSDNYYTIMFVETYLNEWSSALAYHKCKRLGKSEIEFIEKLREQAEA